MPTHVPYTGAPNAELWDASTELGPENGDKGGAWKQVTPYNDRQLRIRRRRVIDDAMRRA